jgi:hypothetical protein
MPYRDPIAAEKRKSSAEKRIPPGAKCECGESRRRALKRKSNRVICARCMRLERGMSVFDQHHPAGRANHPLTVAIPVNDHMAILSEAQYDWPRSARENPDGSPLLAVAACIRGFIDMMIYLAEKLLLKIPYYLEKLDELLTNSLGPRWWLREEYAELVEQEE